jgi:hypothetical protein
MKLGLQFRVFFLSQILVVYLVGGVALGSRSSGRTVKACLSLLFLGRFLLCILVISNYSLVGSCLFTLHAISNLFFFVKTKVAVNAANQLNQTKVILAKLSHL